MVAVGNRFRHLPISREVNIAVGLVEVHLNRNRIEIANLRIVSSPLCLEIALGLNSKK